MHVTVHEVAVECAWELTALLWSHWYQYVPRLVLLYEAQLLSCIESRTLAIYQVRSVGAVGLGDTVPCCPPGDSAEDRGTHAPQVLFAWQATYCAQRIRAARGARLTARPARVEKQN